MLLKYNRKDELEVVGIGIFEPGQFVVVGDEKKAKKYLDSGYFDKVKNKKAKAIKSKKRGVDKL
jgi:hypothetical protein